VRVPHLAFSATLSTLTLAALHTPAAATTLVRQSIERLTAANELIVRASVVEIHSYWNPEHSFILTDVVATPSHVLKGERRGAFTFTVPGGTVGDVTTLILGGPDLAPGSEYVLFLSRAALPGGPTRMTVRDLAQGVFDVRDGRATSQAIGEPLQPDAEGRIEVPGGEDGLPLEALLREIQTRR